MPLLGHIEIGIPKMQNSNNQDWWKFNNEKKLIFWTK